MHWSANSNQTSKHKDYSITNKLRKEGKITKEFEVILSSLTLEDVIAVRMELATRTVSNRLYNLPIWKNLHNIVQEAVLKYALSATRSTKEAAMFLGINLLVLREIREKYKVSSQHLLKEPDNEEE